MIYKLLNFRQLDASKNSGLSSQMEKLVEKFNEFALKKETRALQENIDTLTRQLKFLNETLSGSIDEKKFLADDLLLTKKKLESLGQKVQQMKSLASDSSQQKAPLIDTSKFLDINAFAEFVKMYSKDNEGINFKIEETKRKVDDNLYLIAEKITMKELNTLEESINKKNELLKASFKGKYSEKNETNKMIKYLDAQVII